MPVIYEPAGRAREYAPLAANLYRGCGHRGRNCNSYGCRRGPDGCESLRKWLACYRQAAEQLAAQSPEPRPPEAPHA